MSQYLEGAVKTDHASTAIGAHLRVKTPGALELAGAADFCLGTMEYPCLAEGPASYRVRTAQGTRKMVADGNINKGVTVYAAAGGKISAAAGSGVVEGRSLEAAGANNDVIEVMMSTTSGAASSSVSTTSASSFTIASGSSDAKIKLDTDSKSGGYTLTLAPADDLAGDRKIQIPVTNCTLLGDTLPVVVTTNEANALAVGRAGATNPALKVVGAVTDSATGLQITPAADGDGLAVDVISTNTNESLTIDAKGTGTVTIANTSTGAVTIKPATTVTGELTSSGGLSIAGGKDIALSASTGTKIATNATQLLGFWGATPVVQESAIANATNASTTQERLNDLLLALRTIGLIAT
jgi:hypothetical protein